jgi:ribonuclease-3
VLRDVVGNSNLRSVAMELELARFIEKNPSQPGAVPAGPMATTVEALVGAVFIDSGRNLDVAQSVMEELGLWWPTPAN